MHVLDVAKLALVPQTNALEVEVQDVCLLDLRHEDQLSQVFELVVRLEIKEGEVHCRLVSCLGILPSAV